MRSPVPRPAADLSSTPARERLVSWKEIAQHLAVSVRTVQRWERTEELPVHRHQHSSDSTVYAFPDELDAWVEGRNLKSSGRRHRPKWLIPVLAVGTACIAVLVSVAAGSLAGPERWTATKHSFSALVTGSPEQMFPAWSADGSSIAYIEGSGPGKRRLMVYRTRSQTRSSPDGGKLEPIDRQFPFWSIDSRFVYYFGYHQGKPSLFRVASEGGDPILIQDATAAASLSPDGKTLALLSQSEDGSWRIFTATPPEGERKPYQPEPFAAATLLQWPNLSFAPDGVKMIVAVNLPAAGPRHFLLPWPADQGRTLFKAGPPTGIISRASWLPDSRHLTFHRGADLLVADTVSERYWFTAKLNGAAGHATHSPDGSRTAYQLSMSHTDVVSLPLRDAAIHSLLSSPHSEEQPDCSPVEEKLVYVTNRAGNWQVWISSFDRRWDRPLIPPDDAASRYSATAGAPVFSRDGQMVAFRAALSGRMSGIVVAPTGGGGRVQVVVRTPIAFAPTWSPDGRWIAFVYLAGSEYRLAKVRAYEEQTFIDLAPSTLSGSDSLMIPEWSPTGEWIAYLDERQQLSLISPDGARKRQLKGVGPVAWARDGRSIYQVRNGDRLIVEIDIATGKSRKIRDLDSGFPYATREPGRRLSLTPDGKNLIFSVLRPNEQIWLFDGLQRQNGLWTGLKAWFEPRP